MSAYLYKHQGIILRESFKGISLVNQDKILLAHPSFNDKHFILNLDNLKFPDNLEFKIVDENTISFDFEYIIKRMEGVSLSEEQLISYIEEFNIFIEKVQFNNGLKIGKSKDFLSSHIGKVLNERTIYTLNEYMRIQSREHETSFGLSYMDYIKAYMGIRSKFPRLYFIDELESIEKMANSFK